MKVCALTLLLVAVAGSSEAQFWKYSQQLFNPFAWIRQGKTADAVPTEKSATTTVVGGVTTAPVTATATTTINTISSHPAATKTPMPLPLSYPSSLPPSQTPQSPPTTKPTAASLAPAAPPVVTSPPSSVAPPASSATAEEANLTRIAIIPHDAEDTLEAKMGEIELGPVINVVKVTPPPITTTNAKSLRTTIAERASSATTNRALRVKSTTSPLAAFYASHASQPPPHATRPNAASSERTHASPAWTTVPIATHHNREKTATERTHAAAGFGHTQPLAHSPSTGAHSHASAASRGTTAALRPTVTERSPPQPQSTTAYIDTTTQEATGTTEEPRDNHRQHDFYLSKREKPQVKIATNISQNLLPLPAGASAALVKPTKYHYYPHNQHIYLLPECAIQQVCNAVYVRLNWTQPLCACPSRYRDPCSASLNSDDQHTTELQVDRNYKRALTLVKTCEPTTDMRVCRAPRDWSLLALQNIRTGKSHYLVICRCPDTSILEGPMSHDQPTYASVPGIRVYGMMCVPPQPTTSAQSSGNKRRGRPLRLTRSIASDPPFPWAKAVEFAQTANWDE